MIVVFVIDTSPSMSKHVGGTGKSSPSGMTRLDLAKMVTEEIVRGLKKRIHEHNTKLQQAAPKIQESMCNIGLGYAPRDELLLLSTGRQHASHAAAASCGAGGRLLVGFGDHVADESSSGGNNLDQQAFSNPNHGVDSFQRELKQLTATDWKLPADQQLQPGMKPTPFPEDGGGAMGLSVAISSGMMLMSRYRLRFRVTENFGLGRLPSTAILNPSGGGTAVHALQPACLILITDGECLRSSPAEGGGPLKLQSSSILREFYQEPFRWDQRIFALGVGDKDGGTSTQYLHPQLRTLCEVTGGSHMMLTHSTLSQCSDILVKLLAPPRPHNLPLVDPIDFPITPTALVKGANGTFVNGGPVCAFQAFESDDETGKPPTKNRAMLLVVHSRDIFPIDKAGDDASKTSRAQLAIFQISFSPRIQMFEAHAVMKLLQKLDQITLASRKLSIPNASAFNQQSRFLKRDVYICEWISVEGKGATGPVNPPGMEYFPVLVTGAGRPNLSSGELSFLSIGILHVPAGTTSLTSSLSSGVRISTLTLLPPEPHILIPILIRAAEAEHRALKKAATGSTTMPCLSQKQALSISRNVQLDENWRKELQAYMFRLPPYYQNAIKRSLRAVLPASAHSALNSEEFSHPNLIQYYSKECQQKIRNAEQMAKATNERLERQEAELRRRGVPTGESASRTDQQYFSKQHPSTGQDQTDAEGCSPTIKYGHYDPRSSIESYLAALPSIPAPWKSNGKPRKISKKTSDAENPDYAVGHSTTKKNQSAADTVQDLPAKCLMAFYESRRRWLFGGSGLATRGLYVEGVNNDGSNAQRCDAKRDIMNESLLSFAGVGVSQLNSTTTAKMGDYRERLLWSRAPVVGSGANDSMGVSATTSQNGAPIWSVDDDAMPVAFFDPRTGVFADSVQARVRSRLFVNFGNPYKDKRADSLIPEQFLGQRPKLRTENEEDIGPLVPPTSPPHDSYAASEGEGEAVFASAGMPNSRRSPRKSPSRNDDDSTEREHPSKRLKTDSNDCSISNDKKIASKPPPPPPSKCKTNEGGLSNTPVAPPPPPRRQTSAPPPPPPKQAQERKLSLSRNQSRPPPPSTTTSTAPTGSQTKRPPLPSNGPPSTSSSKPLPIQRSDSAPSKVQLPAPPSAERVRSTSQGGQIGPPPDGLDMQSPDKKPNVNLPPGWIRYKDKQERMAVATPVIRTFAKALTKTSIQDSSRY
ncbi:hypothetical protein IV203_000851 [Nitzschia inconspicua]|uniref:VWFA domain-containing protein n=1 Tax=Nitzschia inconspicua TaxID=303405 RepID=A0A9K3L5S7_9STRA|nr:hypothetical protein IV203_000851 [Nitzschia inconspicua]